MEIDNDYVPEKAPEEHQNGETDWDVAGGGENNNGGLTSDNSVNEALHNFQGRSDLLLEKYVHKVA